MTPCVFVSLWHTRSARNALKNAFKEATARWWEGGLPAISGAPVATHATLRGWVWVMTGFVGDFSRNARVPRTPRTRTISRPLSRHLSRDCPAPLAPTPRSIQRVAVTPGALRRQRAEAQRLAEDVARYVQRLSLLEMFGDALTRAQRWAIRDALRSVYLPLLPPTASADDAGAGRR